MPIGLRLEIIHSGELSERACRRAAVAAYAKVGAFWHQKLLPKHFTVDAKTRYRHEARDPRYLKHKKNQAYSDRLAKGSRRVKGGGLIDNVYSGDMQQAMERTAIMRPFPTRVSIQMTAPRYMTVRPYKRMGPNKFAEIETTTPDEDRQLETVWRDEVERIIQAELDKKKRKRKRRR